MATASEIAALVAQMPDTDREIENRQEDPDRKPVPGAPSPTSKFTGPDPAQAEEIFAAILAGGRTDILHLIDSVLDPSDADYRNYKAAYVLHGLVLHAGRPGADVERRLLASLLTDQLDSDKHSAAVKGSFIRELQRIGDAASAAALGRKLLDSDLGGYAAQALLAIRDGALDQFRAALASAGNDLPVHCIQALGVLEDAASAPALRPFLDHQDASARLTAAWALANSGDSESAGPLLQMVSSSEGWDRIQATAHCRLLARKLTAAGQQDAADHITTALEVD